MMPDLTGEDDGQPIIADTSALRTQLYRGTLMTVGALLAGIAYAVAGWLVGLFAPTLPLPPGTRLALTVAGYSVLVYYVALDTNEDGDTLIDDLLGRLGA